MTSANEMIGNYALKGCEQFNMVLLVPGDTPEGSATTIEGNVDERRGIYKDIPKARHLASIIGIRKMPEEAHDSGRQRSNV